MESIEEVMKKYKLTEEEHNKISEEIQKIILHDKYPVKKPIAIINIAPPASGKTGLNGYATEMFVDNNVVIINSDELKPFHPHVDEIAKYYPQYYTKVTDQESNSWTSDLFDKVLKDGYNVIFEGTGRNARILTTIKEKMKNYKVIVRGMAVNELNCLTSILDRYENQVSTKGWGRLVTLSHFYETYNEMPNTIDVIEKSSVVDSVEIYRRGSLPHKPIKIYDSSEKEYGRFPCAKQSILGGRMEDLSKANENFEQFQISDFMKKMLENEETKNIFLKMKQLNNEYKKKMKNRDFEEER